MKKLFVVGIMVVLMLAPVLVSAELTEYEYTKHSYEQKLLIAEAEERNALSLLLAILVIVGVIFFLLGILVPHSVLTLLGSMTFFVTMILPIPVLSNYPYFGIAFTSILLLFGVIGVVVCFYQGFTIYNQNTGYHKWDFNNQ